MQTSSNAFRPLWPLAGVLLVAVACSGDGPSADAPEVRPAPVALERVTSGSFPVWGARVGQVRAERKIRFRAAQRATVERVHVAEGDRVEAGAPLIDVGAATARRHVERARAELARARSEARRLERLGEQGLAATSVVEQARVGLASARVGLAEARQALENAAIRAPFAGMVDGVGPRTGELVDPGDRLVTLVGLDRMELRFTVSEREAATMAPGVPVTVTVRALGDVAIPGRVRHVAALMDPAAKAFEAVAALAATDVVLRDGYVGRVRWLRERIEGVTRVPLRAVVSRGEEHRVFTVADGTARAHPVEVVEIDAGHAFVRGLDGSVEVVVEGQRGLGDDQTVEVRQTP